MNPAINELLPSNPATSIFSNLTTPEIPKLLHGGGAEVVMYLPVVMAIMVVACVGYYEYAYPEQYKAIIGSILLYFHLGAKNTEIHTTEIPEQSNTYSLLSLLGLNSALSHNLQPY